MANILPVAQSRFALHRQSSQCRARRTAANGDNQLFWRNVETAFALNGSKIIAATCFASMSDLNKRSWRRESPALKRHVNLTDKVRVYRTGERAEADFVRRDLSGQAMVIYVRPWKPPLNAITPGRRYGRGRFSPRSPPLPHRW